MKKQQIWYNQREELKNEFNNQIEGKIFWIFAFSEEDLLKQLKERGLKAEEITSIGGGGFCKDEDWTDIKTAIDSYTNKVSQLNLEYFEEAFRYELANLEYCIGLTSISEVFDAMGLTLKEIYEAGITAETINRVKEEYMDSVEW